MRERDVWSIVVPMATPTRLNLLGCFILGIDREQATEHRGDMSKNASLAILEVRALGHDALLHGLGLDHDLHHLALGIAIGSDGGENQLQHVFVVLVHLSIHMGAHDKRINQSISWQFY